MQNRIRGRETPENVESPRTKQIRVATDRLAAVLQSLDLEAETRLAEEVAAAIRATDRAYELEAENLETAIDGETESGAFVFGPSRREGEQSRDR